MKAYCLLYVLCFPCMFACQSTHEFLVKTDKSNIDLYLDDKFESDQPIYIETEQEIFQLDDEMREMVSAELKSKQTIQQKAHALLRHLFDEEKIALTYDGNANLTATQTYQKKIANCISLTIMAYALADEAGMNVSFREVDVPEYWVRNGQYNLLTGHVNLLITDEVNNGNKLIWGDSATVIDFDPYIAKKHFPTHKITKKTLLAMFYNNKGADALAVNNYSVAYQYLKQATLADNQFSSAWGNLGVLYKITGHREFAEKVYLRSIHLDVDNLNSLGNLANLLHKQGRQDEAQPIDNYIASIRIKNPYYHALLANEALFNNSYQEAIKHYKKAIALDDSQHEFYFGLAKSYFQQDRLSLSKKAMKKAVTLTNVKYTQNLYVAKLNFLNLQGKPNNAF